MPGRKNTPGLGSSCHKVRMPTWASGKIFFPAEVWDTLADRDLNVQRQNTDVISDLNQCHLPEFEILLEKKEH